MYKACAYVDSANCTKTLPLICRQETECFLTLLLFLELFNLHGAMHSPATDKPYFRRFFTLFHRFQIISKLRIICPQTYRFFLSCHQIFSKIRNSYLLP